MSAFGKTGNRKRPGSARDAVVEHIRTMILRAELRRGDRLPTERELVEATGLSRVSVRAGLQTLVAKGVLVTRHGTGTFVADGPPLLDSQPLSLLAMLHGFSRREMFEARQTLEVDVAGMAADRASGNDLAAIAEEVTGMFASLDEPARFLTHDIRFHRAVAVAAGNPILLSLVDMVSSLFYERRRNRAEDGVDLRPIAEMHREIYQAIRERDRERSERLMSEHLRIAEQDQSVVAAWDGDEPVEPALVSAAERSRGRAGRRTREAERPPRQSTPSAAEARRDATGVSSRAR